MAKQRGWWHLELKNLIHNDLTDADREHIAKLVSEGYTCGEVNQDDEDDFD